MAMAVLCCFFFRGLGVRFKEEPGNYGYTILLLQHAKSLRIDSNTRGWWCVVKLKVVGCSADPEDSGWRNAYAFSASFGIHSCALALLLKIPPGFSAKLEQERNLARLCSCFSMRNMAFLFFYIAYVIHPEDF
jgi:hypothetical protein